MKKLAASETSRPFDRKTPPQGVGGDSRDAEGQSLNARKLDLPLLVKMRGDSEEGGQGQEEEEAKEMGRKRKKRGELGGEREGKTCTEGNLESIQCRENLRIDTHLRSRSGHNE